MTGFFPAAGIAETEKTTMLAPIMSSGGEGITGRRLSERQILLLLAAVQFTHIMDFMVMMPLGPQLMRDLKITPAHFGDLISAFAITAGLVGLLAAPFLDRFDRKKTLLFCYAGFTLGTLACGLAQTHDVLLAARAMCGAFGGVSGATTMAIVADMVPPERRARAMGVIMTAFSAAAALGVPVGLKLAQLWKWEAPFLVIAALAAVVWVCLCRALPSVRGHLEARGGKPSPPVIVALLKDGNAWRGLALMSMAVFGHFTIIPYLAPYLVGNVGLPEKHLFLVYLTGGCVTIFTGPWIGRMADKFGKFRAYLVLVCIACCVVRFLTTMGPMPLAGVLLMAALFFIFASGRFVPAQAQISMAVPASRKGAYMSLVGCARDLSSGITAAVGGRIVATTAEGKIQHFDTLGCIAIGVSLLSLLLFRWVRRAE